MTATTVQTSPVTVNPINDAPVLTMPEASVDGLAWLYDGWFTNEDTPLIIPGITVADVDVAETPPVWPATTFSTAGGAGCEELRQQPLAVL